MEREFKEIKKLQFPGIEVSLGFFLLIVLISVFSQPVTLPGILFLITILGFVCFVIYYTRRFILSILINEKGIHYKYYPYIRKEKNLAWNEIEQLRIVKYDALRQFWGWGSKTSKKYGSIYITDGNKGLFITTNSGNKVLLGISNIKGLQEFLSKTPYLPTSKLKTEIEALS